MKKVAIVVGHGPRIDKGAVNANGETEMDWNRDLANRIVTELKSAGQIEPVLIYRKVEKLSPVSEINETKADLAIELHLNASDDSDADLEGTASGTEMIVYHLPATGSPSVGSKKAADALLRAALGTLKLPNRGVRPPYEGRGNRFLSKTTMPAVIVESFFIDHTPDLDRGNAVKQELAKAYADALMEVLQ